MNGIDRDGRHHPLQESNTFNGDVSACYTVGSGNIVGLYQWRRLLYPCARTNYCIHIDGEVKMQSAHNGQEQGYPAPFALPNVNKPIKSAEQMV